MKAKSVIKATFSELVILQSQTKQRGLFGSGLNVLFNLCSHFWIFKGLSLLMLTFVSFYFFAANPKNAPSMRVSFVYNPDIIKVIIKIAKKQPHRILSTT